MFHSFRLLRTIHPWVVVAGDPSGEGTFDMTPKMLQTFFFSLITFTFVYASLLWHRVRLEGMADRVEQLKMKVLSA